MAESGWNTIDSDAGVFTELVEALGLDEVQFNDLYSIDAESLAASAPVYGVIFLFKYGKIDRENAQNGNTPLAGEYESDYQDKGVFFANQTIQNACATQAVLNVLLNKSDEVNLGDDLAQFKNFVTGFDGEMCGETISNSDLIRKAHNLFLAPALIVNEDKRPPKQADEKNDGLFHFIGFVRLNGFIYELDGLKRFPIRHISCQSDDDFCQKLPNIIMDRVALYGNEELRFSLMSITNNKLKQYEAAGDYNGVNEELMKRETWKRENELRKHDYTTLILRLIKGIGKEMDDQQWQELVNSGRKRSLQKLLSRFTAGQSD